jgi:serine/threonine protein kinase/WD40 repeat protein
MNADRNLLFGLLALQLNFVDRHQLVAAFDRWTSDKAQSLAQILQSQGAISGDRLALLEALAAEHLKLHDNDAEKSLADLTPISSLCDELHRLGDGDVEASLAHVAPHRDDDLTATRTWVAGETTSAGMRFRILRPHARGGLGEVYLARDEELHREVALKEIQARHAHDPNSRSRFVLEAEITGGLEHPGIVPVYGLGTYADGRPFYAMRFIKGDSLKEAIERFYRGTADFSSLEFRKLLGRFVDVCNAIEYAHSRGVLHRDLKPGNIMLGKYGETLVVDWGLAKVVGRPEAHASGEELTLKPSSGSGSAPTQMGSAIGTPQYMSPEQSEGRLDQLGPTTDVYSLGATLYTLLTGRAPFRDGELVEIMLQVSKGEFPTPRTVNAEVPRALEAICLKAMSLRPSGRYGSPRALADDIEHWLADEPLTALSDTVFDRAARWTRRHRALARSAAVALLVISAVSTIAAFVVDKALRDEQQARKSADNAAERERRAAESADAEKRKAQLAEQAKDRALTETEAARKTAAYRLVQNELREGLSQCKAWNVPAGLLWMARSLASARDVGTDDRGLIRAARANIAHWRGHTWPLINVLKPDDISAFPWGDSYLDFAFTDKSETLLLLSTRLGATTLRSFDLGTGAENRPSVEIGSLVSMFERRWTFSADGSLLAAACGDGLNVWNLTSRERILQLPYPLLDDGGGWRIDDMTFDAAGERILVACATSVKVWALGDSSLIADIPKSWRCPATTTFNATGDRFFTETDEGIQVWDVAENASPGPLLEHDDQTVVALVFSPGDGDVFTLSDEGMLRRWHEGIEINSTTTSVASHTDFADLFFSADGSKLFVRSDESIEVIEPDNLTVEVRIPTPRILMGGGRWSFPVGVGVSPDGHSIAVGVGDDSLRIWNTEGGTVVCALAAGGAAKVVRFSPDGRYLACISLPSSGAPHMRVWKVETNDPFVETMERSALRILAISNDGRLAVTSDGETLALSSVHSLVLPMRHLGPAERIIRARFSSDDRSVLTLASDFDDDVSPANPVYREATVATDSFVRVWDVATGTMAKEYSFGKDDRLFCLGDGRTVIIGSPGNTLSTLDTESGRRTSRSAHDLGIASILPRPTSPAEAFAGKHHLSLLHSVDGQTLFLRLATDPGKFIWQPVHSGRLQPTGTTIEGGILSTSRDGGRVLLLAPGGWGRLWGVTNGASVGQKIEAGTLASFNAAGAHLLTAKGAVARVWNAETGEPLSGPLVHANPVHSLSLSPNGEILATICSDKTLYLWAMPDGVPLGPPMKLPQANADYETYWIDQGDALLLTAVWAGQTLSVYTCNVSQREARTPRDATAAIELLSGTQLDETGLVKTLDAVSWHNISETAGTAADVKAPND